MFEIDRGKKVKQKEPGWQKTERCFFLAAGEACKAIFLSIGRPFSAYAVPNHGDLGMLTAGFVKEMHKRRRDIERLIREGEGLRGNRQNFLH